MNPELDRTLFPFYSFLYEDAGDVGQRARFIHGFLRNQESEILEPGAGDGRVSLALARLGARVTSLEKSSVLYALALEKLRINPQIKSRITLLPIDILDFPLRKKFDLIIFSNVLSYLNNVELHKYLKQAVKFLAPSGVLIINFPQPTSLRQPQPLQEITKKIYGRNVIRHYASSSRISDTLYEVFFRIVLEHEGEIVYTTETKQSQYIRTIDDLKLLLKETGLEIRRKNSGWNLEPWSQESPTVVLVCRLFNKIST